MGVIHNNSIGNKDCVQRSMGKDDSPRIQLALVCKKKERGKTKKFNQRQTLPRTVRLRKAPPARASLCSSAYLTQIPVVRCICLGLFRTLHNIIYFQGIPRLIAENVPFFCPVSHVKGSESETLGRRRYRMACEQAYVYPRGRFK